MSLFLLLLATHGKAATCVIKCQCFFHSTLTDPVWDQLVFQVEVPRVHLVSVHISGHVSVSEDHLIPECTSSWFPEAHTSVCGCWLWNSSIHCVC